MTDHRTAARTRLPGIRQRFPARTGSTDVTIGYGDRPGLGYDDQAAVASRAGSRP